LPRIPGRPGAPSSKAPASYGESALATTALCTKSTMRRGRMPVSPTPTILVARRRGHF
jgi:hypothetical protein